MAKRNRKDRKQTDVPEGMSRRQAKLAARAAEREAFQKDPRPFAGFASETDLVALQEFVPSATTTVTVRGEIPVHVVTVLPGAGAALRRPEEEGGDRFVALQVQAHSHNPHKDLAYALNWVADAAPGETLVSTIADGNQPELKDLVDPSVELEITEHEDFNWWFAQSGDAAGDRPAGLNPQLAQALNNANAAIVPSTKVPTGPGVAGSAWWVNPGGGKAHIRWVRPDDNEAQLLNALARIAARGELNLGEGTKLAGTFRTHGLVVPVFDLDPEVAPDTYVADLQRLNAEIEKEYANDAQLSADERKQLENIKSRQVTI
ncbi:DUF5926 family protein [Corynebacterium aquatimens]|uniref:DUF5926 domain-containing protein n=1 Tax=Corynebacterium aquatimens TaxID=1190508 RepID=A0A931GUI5_9CORY|nr:DUF5926 family protein [Corynebacterium aquatimens]MBG6122820.1 hypothetical protein [Corynebacterium aquatimens]WJY66845.1 hypothetical protein CAQUA_10795 [Corynebacterium aquatimens]